MDKDKLEKESNLLDKKYYEYSQKLANCSSRRSFLGKLGKAIFAFGAVNMIPLLPVDRSTPNGLSKEAYAQDGECEDCGCPEGYDNDPTSCRYWKYKGISGFPCVNCGGTQTTCPTGTVEMGCWAVSGVKDCEGNEHTVLYKDCCVDSLIGTPRVRGEGACQRCRGEEGQSRIWCMVDLSGNGSCPGAKPQRAGIKCTMAVLKP